MLIRPGTTEDIPAIKKVAEETWPTAYKNVISDEQICFMLSEMYSDDALGQQFAAGHRFLIARKESEITGFCSYYFEDDKVLKISKLYVLPKDQGKRTGKKLIEEVSKRAKESGVELIELNVNRNNPSLQFYLKNGFEILREEDIPYFNFVLNDYVLRKRV